MRGLKNSLTLTLFGGLAVVLPVLFLWLIAQWLFGLIGELFRPLSNNILEYTGGSEPLAVLLVLMALLLFCFVVGLAIRTRVGNWLHSRTDGFLERMTPGYKTVRDVVRQLLGSEDNVSIFRGTPCVAKIYGAAAAVEVTAIITSYHSDGRVTVFVPTAPVPTSGLTFHLPSELVTELPDVSVEAAMRTIISCGSGSDLLLAPRGEGQK